ncbi:hypothetical protein X747_32515 [Mesorhizobium sp. LNJC384A00]|nr:hypothetical protein X750_31475 [Mesorhizobium sp. LNJC394B00]ESY28270.1 hypothetical protein X747_32515 [Mesorhizobium sp. LNJC384A00]
MQNWHEYHAKYKHYLSVIIVYIDTTTDSRAFQGEIYEV